VVEKRDKASRWGIRNNCVAARKKPDEASRFKQESKGETSFTEPLGKKVSTIAMTGKGHPRKGTPPQETWS